MRYLFSLFIITSVIQDNPIQNVNWVLSEYSFPPYYDLVKVDTQNCKVVIRFEKKNLIRTTFNSKVNYLGRVRYYHENELEIKSRINHRMYFPEEECESYEPSKIGIKLMLANVYKFQVSGDTLKLNFRNEIGHESSMTFVRS